VIGCVVINLVAARYLWKSYISYTLVYFTPTREIIIIFNYVIVDYLGSMDIQLIINDFGQAYPTSTNHLLTVGIWTPYQLTLAIYVFYFCCIVW
jgi:hypothetical protein